MIISLTLCLSIIMIIESLSHSHSHNLWVDHNHCPSWSFLAFAFTLDKYKIPFKQYEYESDHHCSGTCSWNEQYELLELLNVTVTYSSNVIAVLTTNDILPQSPSELRTFLTFMHVSLLASTFKTLTWDLRETVSRLGTWHGMTCASEKRRTNELNSRTVMNNDEQWTVE